MILGNLIGDKQAQSGPFGPLGRKEQAEGFFFGFQIHSDNFETTADDIIEAIKPALYRMYELGEAYGSNAMLNEFDSMAVNEEKTRFEAINEVLNNKE